MRVCLIGAGKWGKNYINTLKNTNFELVGIVDPEYKGSEYSQFDNIDNINVAYEVVIIATPIHTHYELVKKLLLLNKHVLVEKPLTLSSLQSKELIELSKKQNKTMMVGYNVLYLPLYKYLNKCNIITYSSQRTVEYVNSNTHILHDLLCHDIAIVIKIFKTEPIYVNYIGNPQEGTLVLTYPHHNITCFASRLKNKRRTISCKTTSGFIELDDLNKTIETHSIEDYSLNTPPLLAQCLDFYHHILNEKKHKENLFISLTVDKVIERCRQ